MRWPRSMPWLVLAIGFSCGRGKDALAPMETERVVLDLLTAEDCRSVEQENASHRVHVRLFHSSGGLVDLLPGLEMTPPARVAYDIPPLPEGAVLEIAPCASRKTRDIPGAVGFRASFEGEVVLDRELASAASVTGTDPPARVSVERGGRLVLETSWAGGAARPPAVGFSHLSIRAPFRHERFFPAPEYPNVVLVLVDTLRADRLHAYGNPAEVSPVLDALAARGTLFEEAYSDSSWTIPSTVSVLTGLSPLRHGVRGLATQFLTEGHVTLAERFLDFGIDTAAFSCNPLVAPEVNFDQGFQTYGTYEWKSTSAIESDVLDWLNARDGGRFFLYLHLVDPHDPYEPDPEQAARFAPDRPARWKAERQNDLAIRLSEMKAEGKAEVAESVAYNLELYDAEIASLDASLGRLFAALDARALLDRTVIAVTSDHGEEFLEHGLVGHSMQLHEECVRVPLILAGPGVPAGRRVSRRVQNRDLGSTLLALARVDRGDFQGTGILLEESSNESAVFFSTDRGMVYEPGEDLWLRAGELHGMRRGRWQLHWSGSGPQGRGEILRLWDMESDPNAARDVAAEEPQVARALQDELERQIAQEERDGSTTLSEGEAEAERLREAGYAGGEDED